jgi:hypothetical protein
VGFGGQHTYQQRIIRLIRLLRITQFLPENLRHSPHSFPPLGCIPRLCRPTAARHLHRPREAFGRGRKELQRSTNPFARLVAAKQIVDLCAGHSLRSALKGAQDVVGDWIAEEVGENVETARAASRCGGSISSTPSSRA